MIYQIVQINNILEIYYISLNIRETINFSNVHEKINAIVSVKINVTLCSHCVRFALGRFL